jgi:hypothetical protein
VGRNPLVVGFAGDLVDPSKTDSASFGWLLGPQLELTSGSNAVKFTQKPVHNPLSVVVAVPAWWRRGRVNLTAFWLTRDGDCVGIDGVEQGCEVLSGAVLAQGREAAKGSEQSTPVSFGLELTGDPLRARELFLPSAALNGATVFRDRMNATTVRAGQSADIVIPGRNLHVGSTVTLGAQGADQITVLPDTSGIVARFNRVQWPGPLGAEPYRGLPLSVWTRAGQAYAGQLIVYPEGPEPAAAPR